MKARVFVTLKDGVLDPQGRAIAHALRALGFEGVNDARQGKMIEIDLDSGDGAAAESALASMCETLLANPVIETYRIEVE